MTSDVSIGETASAAEFFLADGLVVTGSSTGRSASPQDLEQVQACSDLPTFIGSGITPSNVHEYSAAFGYIVGSYLKHDGLWSNEMDLKRLENMTSAIDKYETLKLYFHSLNIVVTLLKYHVTQMSALGVRCDCTREFDHIDF